MKKIIISLFCYTLLSSLPFTLSANDQDVVIGLDVGGGSFSTIDETRKEGVACTICSDLTSVTTLNL